MFCRKFAWKGTEIAKRHRLIVAVAGYSGMFQISVTSVEYQAAHGTVTLGLDFPLTAGNYYQITVGIDSCIHFEAKPSRYPTRLRSSSALWVCVIRITTTRTRRKITSQ